MDVDDVVAALRGTSRRTAIGDVKMPMWFSEPLLGTLTTPPKRVHVLESVDRHAARADDVDLVAERAQRRRELHRRDV